MPARPLPPRTKPMSAASRASTSALLAGGSLAFASRKHPVVLARKSASYCSRFLALMSAGSYEIVVVQAPVFLPSSSIVLAASGIDPWTYPRAFPNTSTLRGFDGLAGAVAGSAAIIFVTSSGQGVCPTVGRLPRPPHVGPADGCGAPAARPPLACAGTGAGSARLVFNAGPS